MDRELLDRVTVALRHYVQLLHQIASAGFDEADECKALANSVLNDVEKLQHTNAEERATLIGNIKKILSQPERFPGAQEYWRELLTKLEAAHG